MNNRVTDVKGTKLEQREKNPKIYFSRKCSAITLSAVLKLSLSLVTPFSSTDLRTLGSYPLTRRFTIAVDRESPRQGIRGRDEKPKLSSVTRFSDSERPFFRLRATAFRNNRAPREAKREICSGDKRKYSIRRPVVLWIKRSRKLPPEIVLPNPSGISI